MAKHTIMLPEWVAGDDLRSIVWDDEAGTVEGEHSRLDLIREILAEPTPYTVGSVASEVTLEDAAHSPADFLRVLGIWIDSRVLEDPLRSTLPPVFDGVEPTPCVGYPCPPGAVQ